MRRQGFLLPLPSKTAILPSLMMCTNKKSMVCMGTFRPRASYCATKPMDSVLFCNENGRLCYVLLRNRSIFCSESAGESAAADSWSPPPLAVRKGRGWALALWWGPSWGCWGPSKRCWGPQQGLNVPKIVSNVTRPFKHVNLDTPTKVFCYPYQAKPPLCLLL